MRLSGGQGSQLSLTMRACVDGNLTKGHFLTWSAQNTAACLLYPNYGESGQMKCGTIYCRQELPLHVLGNVYCIPVEDVQ